MNGVALKSLVCVSVLGLVGCVDNLGAEMATSAATTFAAVIGDFLAQLITGMV